MGLCLDAAVAVVRHLLDAACNRNPTIFRHGCMSFHIHFLGRRVIFGATALVYCPRYAAVSELRHRRAQLLFAPPIPLPGGKPINYDEGWDPKFQDVAVFLPNGARFVFWRGSSYCPFWAGRCNTGFCYECAERLGPTLPVGITKGMDALWDSELRNSRVQIMESTPARVHVRWSYVPCDPQGRISGDSVVEDFYFYPDGFGTRVVTPTMDPVANYELNELIILTPQSAYPFAVLPANLLDMLYPGEEKAAFRFPCFREEQPEAFAKLKKAQACLSIAFASMSLSGYAPFNSLEGVNMAAIWNLPVIFVCENNLYGASTHVSKVMLDTNIARRAACYGIWRATGGRKTCWPSTRRQRTPWKNVGRERGRCSWNC